MIYLAAPYTHADPAVTERRMAMFSIADSILLSEGKVTVSPLSKHFITMYAKIPLLWKDWAAYSDTLMSNCSGLYVLQFDGWDTSDGVKGEIELAEKYGLPITYLKFVGWPPEARLEIQSND